MSKILVTSIQAQNHNTTSTWPEQFDFRPSHSTTTQFMNVINKIMNNSNKQIKTVVALLNMKKAFDNLAQGANFQTLNIWNPNNLSI